LEDRVADTLAVMDAEAIDRADVIGHSEGGSIAIALAARHPDRVRSLILIDAPAWVSRAKELEALADEDNPLPSEAELRRRFGTSSAPGALRTLSTWTCSQPCAATEPGDPALVPTIRAPVGQPRGDPRLLPEHGRP
jgi:pimeloyl-ACP methyl ester carboxylesterase